MANVRDYQGPTVGQSTCSYSKLGGLANASVMSSMAASNASNNAPIGTYNVPLYCPEGPGPNYPPRYDTFSHGQQYQCGGYFSIQGAYPYADCASCKTTFVQRPCSGKVQCGGQQKVEGYCGPCSGGM